jgi:hypothetical protein
MIKFKTVFYCIAISLLLFVIKFRFIDNHTGWKTLVYTDGRGYYAHLPAIFIYHDLQYDFIVDGENKIEPNSSWGKFYRVSGIRGNKYFIGEAVLLLPFFFLATIVSFITLHDVSGYNVIYYSSVGLATLFYLMASLYFLRKLLLLFHIKEKWIIYLSLILVFATNLLYYSVIESSLSHVYSFFAITFFTYQIKKFQITDNYKNLLIAAATLGLITIIRPINIMVVLSVPFITGSWQNFKEFFLRIVTRFRYLIPSIIIFSSVVFLQLLLYYLSYGDFFQWPYAGEGFIFKEPHLREILFGFSHGMFLYFPMLFIAVSFIIIYFKKSVFAAVSFILFFLITTYVISCWGMWNYGGAFGTRPLVEYYTVFTLPFAIGLNEIKNKLISNTFIILAILFSFLCIFQTYQFTVHIIRYTDMTEEKYWKVFLKSDKYYRIVSYPPDNLALGRDTLELKKKDQLDFETVKENQPNQVSSSEAFSGARFEFVDNKYAFSDGFEESGKFLSENAVQYAEINLMVKVPDGYCDAALTLSLEDKDGKIYIYNSYPIGLLMKDISTWKKMTYGVKLPQTAEGDHLKVRIWNPNDKRIFIDDLQLELFSVKKN